MSEEPTPYETSPFCKKANVVNINHAPNRNPSKANEPRPSQSRFAPILPAQQVFPNITVGSAAGPAGTRFPLWKPLTRLCFDSNPQRKTILDGMTSQWSRNCEWTAERTGWRVHVYLDVVCVSVGGSEFKVDVCEWGRLSNPVPRLRNDARGR